MNAHAFRAAFFALAVGAGAVFTPGPTAAQAPAPMKLTLVAGGRTQTLRGTGRCGHEPHAYIYGPAAALWSAQVADPAQQVTLSYWRLAAAGAGAQFTLSVRSGRTQHLINTVQGSAPAGSGRVTLRPTALGGRFDVQGTAADGTTLQVTIECARFGGMYAEGG